MSIYKNGINPKNLNKLEDIFHYQKDRIRGVRVKVEDYEREIKVAAERIEHKRTKIQAK